MASVDWASSTTWSAYTKQEYTKCDDQHNTVAAIFIYFLIIIIIIIITNMINVT